LARYTVCEAVKSFKDPVHGYVDLCRGPARVVDSWIVQRLRWIRQTGFAYLVYHGMEHSRFNHSLGAAHLAREVLGFVASNTRSYYGRVGDRIASLLLDASEVFQLAALVHDVGHMPFSHSSEDALRDARLLYSPEGFDELPREKEHEAYTESLLPHVAEAAEEAGVTPVFMATVYEDLALILRGGERPGGSLSDCASSILHQLIAKGLDVDRMDYLIRDSLYAGVRYGVFDVDRLVRVLLAVPMAREVRGHECTIAVLDKGVSAVEAFLLARFYMFSEVYLHRVVEAYNSIYARLMALLARDGIVCVMGHGSGRCRLEIPPPALLQRGEEEALEAWRRLDDPETMHLIRRVARGGLGAPPEAVKLAGMLVERRHPRSYRIVDSHLVWSTLDSYIKDGVAPSEEAAGLLEELVEMQRRNPLLIVRPLQVDIVSAGGIRVYNRASGRPERLEETRATTARRLRGFAEHATELGLYRVEVIGDREEEVAEAYRLLLQLEAVLRGEQRR